MLPVVVKLPSYTFTPFATLLSEVLTMFTPLAPESVDPARLTPLVFVVVTVDPFAAIDPPLEVSVEPAVTLSICLSLMACGLVLLLV